MYMAILYDLNDEFREHIKPLKANDFFELICPNCNCVFVKTKKVILRNLSPSNQHKKMFCSPKCANKHLETGKIIQCTECGKPKYKNLKSLSLSGNNFCNSSCAASYNNKHKKFGIRRSKLEYHIEHKIQEEYPDLKFICNSKEAIGSELDFYFHSLNLAIELNGIFHYKPIYGIEKLNKIQKNDIKKLKASKKNGIELHIIDISNIKNLNEYHKNNTWKICNNIILERLESGCPNGD